MISAPSYCHLNICADQCVSLVPRPRSLKTTRLQGAWRRLRRSTFTSLVRDYQLGHPWRESAASAICSRRAYTSFHLFAGYHQSRLITDVVDMDIYICNCSRRRRTSTHHMSLRSCFSRTIRSRPANARCRISIASARRCAKWRNSTSIGRFRWLA